MRTIIAGSRTLVSMKIVVAAVAEAGWPVSSVLSGGARGVDYLGECWAKTNKIPLTVCPADWELLGKSAGFARNVEMANDADALIAVWDGISRGTKHMIDTAKAKGLKVYVHNLAIIGRIQS